ncbi:unnamed protein product [Tenebrio molitor]|nr:unnamed protein product [Tenebrio molitor]
MFARFKTADAPKQANTWIKPSRPMKYPYTWAAKIAQFPFKFYFENNWVWRYYPVGCLLSVPVFMYLSRLSNSPANKAKWAEIRRKELSECH